MTKKLRRQKVIPRFKQRESRRTYLREWRQYRGLTILQACERIGMSQGNLSALERGTQLYTQMALEAIAEAYNTEPGFLINVNPLKEDAIFSIWERASTAERQQLVAVAQALVTKKAAAGGSG